MEITPEVAQLLVEGPPGALQSLVVGSRPLDVTRAPDFHSGRIGRLPPGRTLKLDRIEPMTSAGVLRARVRLELEDLEPKDLSTWRELWPAQQPWRSLSWRAHKLAEARREEEMEMEQMALQAAVAKREALQAGALRIQCGMRGMRDRRHARALRQKRAAAAAEAEALALAAAEAEAEAMNSRKRAGKGRQPPPGKEAAASTKGGKGGKADAKADATPKGSGKGGGKPEAKPDAASSKKEDAKAADKADKADKAAAKEASSASAGKEAGTAKAADGAAPKDAAGGGASGGGGAGSLGAAAKTETTAKAAAEPAATKAEGGAAAATPATARAKESAKAEARTSGKGEKKSSARDSEGGGGKKSEGADGGKAGKAAGGKAGAAAKGGAAGGAKKGVGGDAKATAGGAKATAGGAKAEGGEGGEAASDAEQRAATDIQRVYRGKAVRNRLYQMYVTTSKDGAPAAVAAAGAGAKPGLNLKDVKSSRQGKLSSKRSDKSSDKGSKRDHLPGTPTSSQRRVGKAPPLSPKAAASMAPAASGSSPSPAPSPPKPSLERKASSRWGGSGSGGGGDASPVLAASTSPNPSRHPGGGGLPPRSPSSPTRRKSPQKPLNLNDQRIQSELHGWVTLAVGGEAFVSKMTGRLPPHLRRQHSEQWAIRTAIDSERERERAAWREEAAIGGGDGEVVAKIPRAIIPHSNRPPSPRNAYFTVGVTDPGGIGFAYGGVYPGKLHAKGQLVEQHEVRFSIGISGSYLLYVSLRPPHTPWPVGASSGGSPKMSPRGMAQQDDWQLPGSPFLLRVSPGRAYPLSTQLPPEELPLRGGKQTVKLAGQPDTWTASITILSRDKMGNLCEKNQGEEITAGFLRGGPTPAASAHGSGEAGEGTAAGAGAAATSKEAETAKPAGDKPGDKAGDKAGDGGKPKESERRGSVTKPATNVEAESKPAVAGIEGQSATVTELKNGAYKIKWTSDRPGTFSVFVKIDGLHVLGSPARMVLSQGPPSPKKSTASAGGGAA